MNPKPYLTQGSYSDYWDLTQDSFPEEIISLRRSLAPNWVPSGISGFNLHKLDHVALFVCDSGEDHLNLLAKFVAAGCVNRESSEIISLELSQGRGLLEAKKILDSIIGERVSGKIDIRDSERNYSDYQTEHFTLEGMWSAMKGELKRIDDAGVKMFRCASEDCSIFLRWLDNPHDYLAYEARLSTDLSRILNTDHVQLCTFRLSLINQLGLNGHINPGRAIEEILASHKRIILMTGRGLYFDKSARNIIKSWYPVPFITRMMVYIKAALNKLFANTIRRPN